MQAKLKNPIADKGGKSTLRRLLDWAAVIALVLCLIAMVIIIFYNEKRVMKTIEEGHDKEAAILKGNSHE